MASAKDDKQSSVQRFKGFVKEHPKLATLVRNGEKTWQELFEEWYLLGGDDPLWKKYRQNNTEKENETVKENIQKNSNKNIIKSLLSLKESAEEENGLLNTITGYVRKMDPDQIQGQITNVQSAIENIQKIVSIFNPSGGGASTPSTGERKESKSNPFTFRKD